MFQTIAHDGPIPTLELGDLEAESAVVLAPARGGMVIGFRVKGRELLYLDRATFEDPRANVRGGNPVLFPSPGKLVDDAWSWGGESGAMKQHGFARNLPWEVTRTAVEDGAAATLRLTSSEVTRAQYPWDFEAEYTYTLRGATLRIKMDITARGPGPMPFGVGFHPYFAVAQAEKGRVRIATRATRAFDNARKLPGALGAIDLTADEVDLHLLDHGSSACAMEIEGKPESKVWLRGSPEFGAWVIWTLKGRDFVCLEPWSCRGDALNTGEGVMVLGEGETRSLWVEIEMG